MSNNIPIIAFLSDFGDQDPYAGIVKGVMSQIAPASKVIDLTHNVSPGDVQRAALILWQAVSYFPQGTIFLAVVDPSVGSKRLPIILKTKQHIFIGPDNGLFTYVTLGGFTAWQISNPRFSLPIKYATFHGRDIFGPVAAYASIGHPCEEFGLPIENIQKIELPRSHIDIDRMHGEILYVDYFGNLITSLGKFIPSNGTRTWMLSTWLPESKRNDMSYSFTNAYLQLNNGQKLRMVSNYTEINENECAGLVGSSGLIEIAANGSSAAKRLDLKNKDEILLMFPI
ncbi:MAG: SAM-dependent chlorinase/fluorinase [Chloroflexota bacterium]|jgi:S-adenosylmethionine hydrolase